MFLLYLVLFSQADADSSVSTKLKYDLKSFRVPESGAMHLWINFGTGFELDVNVLKVRDTIPYTPEFDKRLKEKGKGYGNFGNLWIKNSERSDLYLNISSQLLFTKKNKVEDRLENTLKHNSHEVYSNAWNYYISCKERWFFYPFKEIFFYGLKGNCSVNFKNLKTYNCESFRQFSFQGIREKTSYDNGLYTGFDMSLMVGLGRIRPLEYPSRAIVIAEVLEEEGICVPDSMMIAELAELFARRFEYPVKYRHPDWEFYDDIEELLESYGVKSNEISIRTWMQIIEKSHVWDFNHYTKKDDIFAANRPYGLRLELQTLTLDINGSLTKNNSFYKYRANTIRQDYYDTTLLKASKYGIDFGLQPAILSLSGGYPISNTIHFYGSASFSVSPFRYLLTKKWEKTTSLTTEIIKDSIRIKNDLNPTAYGFSCDLLIRKYITYNLSVDVGYWGGFTKSVIRRYYRNEESEWWHNTISINGKYHFLNRFIFTAYCKLRVSYHDIYRVHYRDRKTYYNVYPYIGAGINYRFF